MKKLVFFISIFVALVGKSQNDIDRFLDLHEKAENYYNLNTDSCVAYSLKCLNLAEQLHSDTLKFISYLILGNGYGRQFKFTESTEAYLNALKLVETKHDSKKGLVLGNLGNLYRSTAKYDESYRYFKLSYEAAVETGDFNSQINQLNNMCDYFNLKNLPDSSLNLLFKALAISKAYKAQAQICFTYDNIANTYFTKGEITNDKSYFNYVLAYADTALAIHAQLKDTIDMIFTYGLLGATHTQLGNYKKAENYYEVYQSLNKKTGDISGLLTGYDELSTLYKLQNKFEKAYQCRVRYDSIYKLYLNETSNQQVEELNTKYQTEKKEKENQLLQAKNTLSSETIKRQKATVISVILGLIVVLAGSVFIFINLRNQKKANKIISEQKVEVELQKSIVDVKNKEITDSINYAKRIQTSILPSDNYIKKYLKDHFILYKPKDIVSGDFYWTLEHKNKFYLVMADCTGHGVPGAMLSMLGINTLNQLIAEKNILEPDAILNNLRTEIIKAINPEGSKEESKDGMDISLLVFDFKKKTVSYSCANHSFYILRNNELLKQSGDRMPIGKSPKEDMPFTKHEVALQENDMVITLTDGYFDQFGGEKGKKFKAQQFEELIVKLNTKPLIEIKSELETTFTNWKGNLEQVDDICIMGVRV